MSKRIVAKEIDVKTIIATVMLSDGTTETISTDGYVLMSSPLTGLFVMKAEILLERRIKNNVAFVAESGNEIFGKHIVKIINKQIVPKIIKYNEVYNKFLFFPEELSHYEGLAN